ncbi:MAG: polysaccharide deacetylase family protein [Bdellovibrionaceae bacterium]|nr:polysaccharide deacetylase family protein [Pseudobdellovibrionaceae bacterium]
MDIRLVVLLLSATALVGCSDLRVEIRQSLRAQEEASSLEEWINSEYHPQNMVEKWKSADRGAVCRALQSFSAKEISVYEEEIKSQGHEFLEADCHQNLIRRIEGYWLGQRRSLRVSMSSKAASFGFPDRIQYRDVSRGYLARTGDVGTKQLVLTFDDGPHPQHTPAILAALAEVNAKGIFFMLGNNVRGNESIVKAVAEAGHAVGSHSMSHRCLGDSMACFRSNKFRHLSFAEASAEIREAHRLIDSILGWVDPFFRFPFGESSKALRDFLAENGIGDFLWNIDSNDWRNQTPAELVTRTMREIQAHGRGIVLFHDTQRKTAEAMPFILSEIYYQGYTPVLLLPSEETGRRSDRLLR